MEYLSMLVGMVLLYFGGEFLVRNASSLARRWGVSPLVIGLTVVAFGTSAPELAASLAAALGGSSEIALGNVVGSNIANVALILGAAAVVYPMRSSAAFLRREMPIMLGVSALLILLFIDGVLGRFEGLTFVLLVIAYLVLLLRSEERSEVVEEFDAAFGEVRPAPSWRAVVGALLGLGLLVLGARFLVGGATAVARGLGIPELVIGLTLVAVGTSLPELATSLIAALRKEADIALGNVVGSNIFNVLFILGTTSLVSPIRLPFARVGLDFAVMFGLSLLLFPFLFTGRRLGRGEGALLLAAYVGYVAFLYLR